MEDKILELFLTQGVFAVLFLYLLFYVLKENAKRESKYQEAINNFTKYLPKIDKKLQSIEVKIKKENLD